MTRTTLAACLVLHDSSPALAAEVRDLVAVADEVVVYDTASHLTPGSPAFEATLHPAVTVVSGFHGDDREGARRAAMAHVSADWALYVLAGEKVTASRVQLRDLLGRVADAPAMSVWVDDIVRGTHRAPRLVHTAVADAVPTSVAATDLGEVPSTLLTVSQPASAQGRLPRQRRLGAHV